MTRESGILEVNDASFYQQVLVRSHELPVVVDFWAPWCGPCRQLAPILERVAASANGRFVLAKLNVDDSPAIARQYGVQSIPLVVAFKDGAPVAEFLGAQPEPIAFYREMEASPEFVAPRRWADCAAAIGEFDALVLAGGHAPGMRQYLGSEVVQQIAAAFFGTDKPIAAICHGVLVAARAKRPDGRSVLYGLRTTCLPKYMERTAFFSTFWLRGRYYRTYPDYVEDEVRASLASPEHFVRGPRNLSKRGTRADDAHALVVEDGRYMSGRWPGDAYLLAKVLIRRLAEATARISA